MRLVHRWLAGLALACLSVPALAGYSTLIAFGDSLSDNGNMFALSGGAFPPPPYVDGRVSNGPVAVEYMAGALGLPLVDFAFAGAKTGPDVAGHDNFRWDLGLDGTGMQAQLAMFSASLGGGAADANALYYLWGGPNDYFEPTMTPAMSVGYLDNLVNGLYGLGARSFFVPNMPDLGSTPDVAGTADGLALSAVTQAFNSLLDLQLLSWELALADASFIRFDTYDFFAEVLAQPADFGFTDVTMACLDTACALDPQLQATTVFWDGVHPTTAGHAVLGQAFAEAVGIAEPRSLVLAATALLLLAALRRRRG